MRRKSYGKRVLGVAFVLAALVVPRPMPVRAQAEGLAEELAKQAVKDLQNLTQAAKIVAKRGGRSAAKIAGPLDALLEVLENGPTLACAFWRMQLNRTLEKLTIASAGDDSVETAQTLQGYQKILNRIAVACDPPIQQGDQGGGGGAPEGDEGGSEPPPEDGPPPDLTSEEKACWPFCREPWKAVESAIEGVRLRLEREKTAENVASESEKMLKDAQWRLQQAEQAWKAQPQGPGTEARRAAAYRARVDAGNDVRARQADAERARSAAAQAAADLSTWKTELSTRRAAYRQCLQKCALSASEPRRGLGPKKWVLIGGLAAGGAALAAGGGSSGTGATPGANPTAPPTPPPTPPPTVDFRTGRFGATLQVSQNAGRHPNLLPPELFTLLINGAAPSPLSSAPIRVRVTGSAPAFIPVDGTVGDDGRLEAGGGGVYSGFATAATLELTISASGAISGRYSIGTDGRLPTGQPISWTVTGTRAP